MEITSIKVVVSGAQTSVKAVVQPAPAPAPQPEPVGVVAAIPVPQLEVVGGELAAYFLPNSFDFSKGNPELFLFRYKNARKKNRPAGDDSRRKGGWVHPANFNWVEKWKGWGFFGGVQAYDPVMGGDAQRITEFEIPQGLKNYMRFPVPFNKYMFWRDGDKMDMNVVAGINYYDFDKQNFALPSQPALMGTGRYRNGDEGRRKMPKVQKFALAVAVDNAAATKTNGLCPKIFGALSEPFFTRFALRGMDSRASEIIGIEIGFSKYKTAHNA